MSFYRKILLIAFVGLFSFKAAVANDNKQLQFLRQSIKEQESKLAQQKKQRTQLVSDLQQQETEIAKLLTAIEKNNLSLNKIEHEMAGLAKQVNQLQTKQKQQQDVLAKQLEMAFRLGRTTGMELIFAGEQSQRNERIISYYGYLNEARLEQINLLKETTAQLNDKKIALESKKNVQRELQNKQKEVQEGLEKNRQSRQKTIESLDSSMQVNQQRLNELRENESKLQAQISQAEKESRRLAQEEARQAREIKQKQTTSNYTPNANERALMARVSGIGKPMNQLKWPVSGNVIHHFGDALQGELRWKGMVINAKDGIEVKAIAEGRVILASWLQGYGFVVVLEHGKGDMSLYGYNQRVLVEVNDKVSAGQPIALVGSSGGQSTPSLYFEIRRDGRALDPSLWLAK